MLSLQKQHAVGLSVSGRPTEIDPTLSKREVASKLRRAHCAIHYQFKQLRLVSKLGQWVPNDLSPDQKQKNV